MEGRRGARGGVVPRDGEGDAVLACGCGVGVAGCDVVEIAAGVGLVWVLRDGAGVPVAAVGAGIGGVSAFRVGCAGAGGCCGAVLYGICCRACVGAVFGLACVAARCVACACCPAVS